MIPLICIDVDGTLVGPSGEPTDVVWRAADRAIARGQHLALTTARGAFGPTFDWAKRLDPNGWHIFHSGGALVHSGTGDVRAEPLDPQTVQVLVDLADENRWIIELYTADAYAVDSHDELAIAHAALMGVAFEQQALATLTESIVRAQFVVPTTEAASVLASAPTAVDASEATSPVMPGISFVSMTTRGITKASAIDQLCREFGITMADVMMVGDGHNDLGAIRAVGHGTAMGNAEPQVLAAARHVVSHVTDDGLAEALEISAHLPD